jgi:hypothetical protein
MMMWVDGHATHHHSLLAGWQFVSRQHSHRISVIYCHVCRVFDALLAAMMDRRLWLWMMLVLGAAEARSHERRDFDWDSLPLAILTWVVILVAIWQFSRWRTERAAKEAFGADPVGGLHANWLHHTTWQGHTHESCWTAGLLMQTWTTQACPMTIEAVAWNTATGVLIGTGTDHNGRFSIDGRYSAATGRVVFLKRHGACSSCSSAVLFQGHVNADHVMSGTWTCSKRGGSYYRGICTETDVGPFELRPHDPRASTPIVVAVASAAISI